MDWAEAENENALDWNVMWAWVAGSFKHMHRDAMGTRRGLYKKWVNSHIVWAFLGTKKPHQPVDACSVLELSKPRRATPCAGGRKSV